MKNKEMLESSIKELQFANLQVEALCNTLREIEAISEDNLVKKIIENTMERHNLDRLIHSKKFFN